MTKAQTIEKAISQMEAWAADDSHGYDQIYRWGQKGDFDCSAAVISAWQLAEVPVKDSGATYTGNMLSAFKKCGFKDVTSSITLSTGAGLQRGDVLLHASKHTAMYCGGGMEVEASINEKGTATGGTPGDQTGREFLKRSYRNFPWQYILRYTEAEAVPTTGINGKIDTVQEVQYWLNNSYASGLTIDNLYGSRTKAALVKALQKALGVTAIGIYNTQTAGAIKTIRKGSTGNAVKVLQALLICNGQKLAYVDGDFGSGTETAVKTYQKIHGLEVDGIAGKETFKSLCG